MSTGIDSFKRQFKATANTSNKATPYLEFPALFEPIKRKFPDLADELDAVQKSVAEWVKSVQTNQ